MGNGGEVKELPLDGMSVGLSAVAFGGIVETIASPLGGRLYDRIGPRPIVVPGALMYAGALLWLGRSNTETSVVSVIVAFVVLSLGIALTFTPLMTASLAHLPQHQYGHGSAILMTLLQVMGAAATAVMVALFSLRAGAAGASLSDAASGTSVALTVAAGLACVAVVLSFLVRRPVVAPVDTERLPRSSAS